MLVFFLLYFVSIFFFFFQVDLRHINYDTFHNMLSELFRNGIDKYCIVALFYFCSDVLIRCVKNELHRLGSRLFFWALQFLVQNVCSWVYDHGGWVSKLRLYFIHLHVIMKIILHLLGCIDRFAAVMICLL